MQSQNLDRLRQIALLGDGDLANYLECLDSAQLVDLIRDLATSNNRLATENLIYRQRLSSASNILNLASEILSGVDPLAAEPGQESVELPPFLQRRRIRYGGAGIPSVLSGDR